MNATQNRVKKWVLPGSAPDSSGDVEAVLAYLLKRRGFASQDDRERFLSPRLKNLADPLRIPDMERAVRRIDAALLAQEQILIYSDYDADGMTSSALLYLFLRELGASVRVFLPDRMGDGYGLSEGGIQRILEDGQPRPSLVIALDCGTTSRTEVDTLNGLGIDVVIIDHHELPEKYPNAHALVNPQRSDHDRNMATVGLVFKFCHAFLKLKGDPGLFDLKRYLDLVALGTVADLVPLEDDNRIFVYQGLKKMAETENLGLQELMRTSGLKRPPTPSTLGFVLGPRLNASGRVAGAMLGWELLTTRDRARAMELSQQLDGFNRQRQKLEQDALEEAEASLGTVFDPEKDRCIVTASRDWHQGVIGIVASRLLRSYYKPSIVISIDENGKGKGSARGIDGFSLMDALRNCREHLIKFGGHAMAAGLTLGREDFPAFAPAFDAAVRELTGRDTFEPVIETDGSLESGYANAEVAGMLQQQVWGAGFAAPLFLDEFTVRNQRLVGEKHLKLSLERGHQRFDAIWFGHDQSLPEHIQAAYRLEQNVWNGMVSVQLVIEHAG